jgi:hypothetical protein
MPPHLNGKKIVSMSSAIDFLCVSWGLAARAKIRANELLKTLIHQQDQSLPEPQSAPLIEGVSTRKIGGAFCTRAARLRARSGGEARAGQSADRLRPADVGT